MTTPCLACWKRSGGLVCGGGATFGATFGEAAGLTAAPANPIDGVSLLAHLTEDRPPPERTLFWGFQDDLAGTPQSYAARRGQWKYLRVDGHDYLFDITQNERERANQGGLRPPQLQGLRRAGEAWNGTMPTIAKHATVSPGPSVKDMPQR